MRWGIDGRKEGFATPLKANIAWVVLPFVEDFPIIQGGGLTIENHSAAYPFLKEVITERRDRGLFREPLITWDQEDQAEIHTDKG